MSEWNFYGAEQPADWPTCNAYTDLGQVCGRPADWAGLASATEDLGSAIEWVRGCEEHVDSLCGWWVNLAELWIVGMTRVGERPGPPVRRG